MKITKRQLDEVRQIAIGYFVDDANHGDLDDKQWMAQCWLKAASVFFQIKEELEFPVRKSTESIEDVNG